MDEQIRKRVLEDYAKSKQTWPINGPTFKHFANPQELERHKKEVAEAQKRGAPF